MENNFDDKLSQKFRETLENYPVAYEQGAWEQFSQNHLHKPPVRLVALWRHYAMRIAAALLIAVAGLFTVYYWRNRSLTVDAEISSAPITPEENQYSKAEPLATITEQAAQTGAENAQQTVPSVKNISSAARQKNRKSALPADLAPMQTLTKSSSNPRHFLQSEQQPLDSVVFAIAEPVALPRIDLLPLTLTHSFAWQFPVLAADYLPIQDLATAQSGRVIKVQPGAQLISGIMDGKAVENVAVFYGGGVGVEFLFQNKIALTTNLQFVQTTYETPERRFRAFNSLQRDPIGTQQLTPVYAEETEYTRIRLNLLQIPLTVKYLLNKKLFLNAGAVSYITAKGTRLEKVTQNTFLGRVQNPREAVENTFQPFRTIHLGGGMRLPMKNMVLQVEPHVNIPLGDILQDVNNTSLQWVGLNMGVYLNR